MEDVLLTAAARGPGAFWARQSREGGRLLVEGDARFFLTIREYIVQIRKIFFPFTSRPNKGCSIKHMFPFHVSDYLAGEAVVHGSYACFIAP